MQEGRPSQTAVLVCMARAAAHGKTAETRYSDPTALTLLPDDARARVERHHSGAPATTLRERMERAMLDRRAGMMVARTVEIDEAVRAAASPQVVILGAGLDGRAWRMPELAGAVVFEVDHPASQGMKRERVAALTRAAREVRFVPVDFTRDRLVDALQAAGHDPALPTSWVWEGVVMYLSPAEVESTVTAVAARSAPGSRLVVLYTKPSWLMRVVGFIVRRLGEPFRSSYQPAAMRALLEKHGFTVVRDEGVPAIGAAMAPDVAEATRIMKHLRIVTADVKAR